MDLVTVWPGDAEPMAMDPCRDRIYRLRSPVDPAARDTLVADGLAAHSPNSDDRCRQIITLTTWGSTLLAEMEGDFDG